MADKAPMAMGGRARALVVVSPTAVPKRRASLTRPKTFPPVDRAPVLYSCPASTTASNSNASRVLVADRTLQLTIEFVAQLDNSVEALCSTILQ